MIYDQDPTNKTQQNQKIKNNSLKNKSHYEIL